MSSTAVLVPVKARNVKSRLAGLLDEGERRDFARLLLEGVLAVIREAGLARSTHVISSDSSVRDIAARVGADFVDEPGDRGVNAAVAAGMSAAESAETILVVPSDLPLLSASDVEHLMSLKSSGMDIVIAPSVGFNGTNALAFSRAEGFPLSYDADSFWNHIATAAKLGLRTVVCCDRGLTFDVDTAADFGALSDETLNRPSVNFARSRSRWPRS